MRRFILPILGFLSIISPALAEEQTWDPNRFVISGGIYNFMDDDDFQRPYEYRFEARLSEIPIWKLHPWLGAELVNDNYVGWYGGGLETDIDLYRDLLVLTLQTGMGYFEDGDEPIGGMQYNPKSGFEFRHTAELGVRLGHQGWRAGVGISHMSNANIGGGNNSVNGVQVNLHIPLTLPGRLSRPE